MGSSATGGPDYAALAIDHQSPAECGQRRLDLLKSRGVPAIEQPSYLRRLPAEPLRQLALVQSGRAHRPIGFELGRGQRRQSNPRAAVIVARWRGQRYVFVVRHVPKDHFLEQILGASKRLIARLGLAPAVRQVGGN